MSKKIYVLDTNILIDSAGSAIYGFDDNDVVITSTTLMELDKHKKDEGERGFDVRECVRIIRDLMSEGDIYEGIEINKGGSVRIEKNGHEHDLPEWMMHEKSAENDNRILATTLTLMDKNPDKKVAIITNDVLMSIRAAAIGIEAQEYKNDQIQSNEAYKGRITLNILKADIDTLYAAGEMAIPAGIICHENEFIELHATDGTSSALAWVKGGKIELLTEEVINRTFMGVTPKNVGQRFMAAALSAKDIPLCIIIGGAGSGKTLLSTAIGLDSSMTGDEFYKGEKHTSEYSNVYITRSNTIPEGEDLGFLPGDLRDKMDELLAPFYDSIEQMLRMGGESDPITIGQHLDYMTGEGGVVKIVSMAYVRGRSIPNSYIIVDEAQNLTPKQVKTIITRAGVGTKIILLGDPGQIDRARLTSRSNGLVFAADKFMDSPLCAVVTLNDNECVRSELAKEAATIM